MVNALSAFGALFTAVFILLTGNGLLTTLLSTRMAAEGFSTAVTGLVLSGYYIGLLAGYFRCHRLIQRVGHIRAFTVFATGTTAAALLHGLYLSPLFWGALRFLCGVTSFGLFMVIESWLNECTESHYRGRVFSIYMILSYLGIGIGQQLLNIGDIMRHELFTITGIIFAICLIPVSATEGVHPQLPQRERFSFAAIFRKAPLSMLGCMSAGLTNSSFYAMTPVVCTGLGLTLHQLSWIMTITVFSGLIAQGVIGRLSERIQEAYSVIGNPAGRKVYEKSIAETRVKRPTSPMPRSKPEPLIPEKKPWDLGDISPIRSFETFPPSYLDRFGIKNLHLTVLFRPRDI